MDRRHFLNLSAASLCASALPLSRAFAAPTLAGKDVTVVIPFGVGGGNDLWGRFIGGFLQKYLPGSPNVIIKNSPGGGSVSGANYFAATAKGDGLTVLVSSGSTQFPYLLGEPRVKYDYKKMRSFLAGPTGGVAYISSKLGVTSLKDLSKLKGTKLHFASQGITSLDMTALLAFNLFGLDVQHIIGYPGRAEGRMAFERGETDIDYQTTSAYLRSSVPLVKKGDAVPLFAWGLIGTDGRLIRDPNFPDLPHVEEAYEIAMGHKPSGIEWEAFTSFLISGFPAQKLMLLPGDTPDDIVEMYKGAIRAMRQDKEYIEKRDDMIGEYDQVTDEAGDILFKQATSITPEARTWVRDFLSKNYDVKFE
jgi:tripartite-type tricarboxylate transporter receptor subunit TctC